MTGDERRIILDRGFDRTVDVILDAFLQEGFRLNPVGAGDLRRQPSPRTRRYAMLDAILPGLAVDPRTAPGCRVSIFELTAGCTLVTIARPAVGYPVPAALLPQVAERVGHVVRMLVRTGSLTAA